MKFNRLVVLTTCVATSTGVPFSVGQEPGDVPLPTLNESLPESELDTPSPDLILSSDASNSTVKNSNLSANSGFAFAPATNAKEDSGALDDAADKPRIKSTKSGSTELSLTRDQMIEIFKGDFSSLPNVRIGNEQPSTFASPSYSSSAAGITRGTDSPRIHVLPKNPNSEQALRIAVIKVEHQINKQKQALMEAEDGVETETVLKKLAASYQLRFELDTAYQDFKVSEIERRAKKLRAEVDAREQATQQWVDAMVTLSKMKAAGIETMNAPSIGTADAYFPTAMKGMFQPNRLVPAPPTPATQSLPPPSGLAPPRFGKPPQPSDSFQPPSVPQPQLVAPTTF